jgi:hypothetical protein
MTGKPRRYTEYIVRCKRWVRNINGEKVWETVDLKAVNEGQARYFYDDIRKKKGGVLKKPTIIVRDIIERQLD